MASDENNKKKMSKKVNNKDEKTKRTEFLVKANLRLLFDTTDKTQVQLAEYLHISRPAVSQWLSEKGSMPTSNMLSDIADFFGVSVDWLYRDHSATNYPPLAETYAEAVRVLQPFVLAGYFDPKCINDEILRYLLVHGQEILPDSDMKPEEKTKWITIVSKEFNEKLPQACNPDAYRILNTKVPSQVRAITELDSYVNAVKLMSIHPEYLDPDFDWDIKGRLDHEDGIDRSEDFYDRSYESKDFQSDAVVVKTQTYSSTFVEGAKVAENNNAYLKSNDSKKTVSLDNPGDEVE